MGFFVAERAGINLYAEYSLHEQLKQYLAKPGDRLEASIEGKVIDLVRADGELVEVQTGHLGQLKPKALELAGKGHCVRIVYPISDTCELRRLDPSTGEVISVRKSPKRGNEYNVFNELVYAPELIAAQNITVEILIVRSIEIKIRDGSGSWWRKGDRTVDKELTEVLSSRSFHTRDQWLALIPNNLASPWNSLILGESLGINPEKARKVLYCLCRAGLLVELNKNGRHKTYEKA